MKSFILTFSFLFLLLSSGFGQFVDDFSDGDFTNNPEWFGNVDRFSVEDEVLRLTHETSNADQSYLVTENTMMNDATWEFFVKFTFQPSGSNLGRVYLTSDSPDLTAALNGYFVYVGGASREISLFKQEGGTTTKIIDGFNGRLASDPVNVRIRVDRDAAGNWELYSDTLGGTNYYKEGTVFDDTHTTTSYFGVRCTYTQTRSDRFYFDDFYVGDFIEDNDPPELLKTAVNTSTEVTLFFNESVTELSAEDVSNYTLDNGGTNPILAQRDNHNFSLVYLTFADPFEVGTNYTLTIDNIEDMSGNVSNQLSASILYVEAQTPEFGDIIINEFLPNESPSVGLAERQYVELYNRSDKYFHLDGWKLSDRTGTGTIQDEWIYPGEYLLLVPTSGLSDYPEAINVTNWQNLNNTGDDITLESVDGIIVDELSYTDDWYKDDDKDNGGYSLERINPNPNCLLEDNWRASEHPDGGTPGVQNSVYDTTPDTITPQIKETIIVSNHEIRIEFTKGMDSTILANTTFNVTPSLQIEETLVAQETYPRSINFVFVDTFPIGMIYEFNFENISDCSGNTADLSGSFQYVEAQTPEFGDIIINEFLARENPSVGLPERQFVEIYNRSNKYFRLNGWKLSDRTGSGTIQDEWIYPGEYLLLVPTSGLSDYPEAINVTSWQSLNNTGDDIQLSTPDSIIVDQLSYTDAWYKNEEKSNGGYSIERINPELKCSGEDNWRASNDPMGGTPGTQNSVYSLTPDTTPPKLLEVLVISEDEVRFTFNEGMDSSSLINAFFLVEPLIFIEARVLDQKYPRQMILKFEEPLIAGEVYNFDLEGASDCSGNGKDFSGSFVLPQVPDGSEIIINEILHNTLTGGSDFIELYNRSEKYIDLKGWQLANHSNDTIASHRTIEINYILAPDDYVVITRDSSFQLMNYPFAVSGKFIQLPSLPSYTNNGSTVYLIHEDEVIDMVEYTSDWHFRLLHSQRGVSLERFDPFGPSNDENNWHSASETVGFATPGRINSQMTSINAEGTLTLSSESFSPDNDGFEDVLLITYRLTDPEMLGKLIVYDDMGRKIRTLFTNHLLGAEGVIKWDGIRDDGNKASIGPYIILFEAFNATNAEKIIIRKVVTLAGRL